MWQVRSFTVFILVACSHLAIPQNIDTGLLGYTLSVIEYLADHHPASFTGVFYDTEDLHPYDNLLSHLLSSPRLDHVAKLIVNNQLSDTEFKHLPEHPSLVVFRVGRWNWTWKDQVERFHHLSKVLVLMDCRDVKCRHEMTSLVEEAVKELRFSKVVCLGSQFVARMTLDWRRWSLVEYYPDPAELFEDATRDLHGRRVTYTWRYGDLDGNEMEVMWLEETARHVNATLVPLPHDCPDLSEGISCYFAHVRSNRVDFGVRPLQMVDYELFAHWIRSPWISKNTFIAPMGRKIKVLEYFLKPFSWKVWLAIGIIVIVTEFVHTFIPRAFHIDPIMAIIGGFQRICLNRAGHLKRIALTILIIGFFFLLSAYEAQITSLFTTEPSIKTPKTIRDLQDAKIPIKAHLQFRPDLLDVPEIAKLLVHFPEDALELDGSSAYFLFASKGEYYNYIPYYIFYAQTHGYSEVPFVMEMFVMATYSIKRNPLQERFQQSLDNFRDTGLVAYWTAEHFSYTDTANYSEEDSEKRLNNEDLIPAYVVLGAGFLAAGVLLILEVFDSILPRIIA